MLRPDPVFGRYLMAYPEGKSRYLNVKYLD